MAATYDPELYDVETPGTLRGDLEWYCGKAEQHGGPVLELGAGTGRITVPIAERGIRIHALDSHRGMLERLQRKLDAAPAEVRRLVTVSHGDMRTFRLGEAFRLVIIPYRAFLHNLTTDDQLACLARVHEHLAPGGHVALNMFHPSLEVMAARAGSLAGVWRWSGTHERSDGGYVLSSEATRYDTVLRRVHVRLRAEVFGPDGNLQRTFINRLELAYLYPQDIRSLLERAGFESIEIHGDFTGRPFQHDGDELVIEAERR
jgi:SAM-dependent methyltransferase